MSTISRDEVARLAKLARLALTDEEISGFAGQLDAILGYVGQIQAVDVTGVVATDNPLKNVNVTRPDVVAASLTQTEALAEAPAVVDERFAVRGREGVDIAVRHVRDITGQRLKRLPRSRFPGERE